MTPIIEDALRHGGKTVQATLYEGLKALFDKLDERLSRIDDRDMDPSQLKASLVALADRLLFREVDLPLETTRTKRAQATVGYITVCQRVKFRVSETQRQRIVAWLGQERSGPVQRILSQALGKLDG